MFKILSATQDRLTIANFGNQQRLPKTIHDLACDLSPTINDFQSQRGLDWGVKNDVGMSISKTKKISSVSLPVNCSLITGREHSALQLR